jgi:hypothetical protein
MRPGITYFGFGNHLEMGFDVRHSSDASLEERRKEGTTSSRTSLPNPSQPSASSFHILFSSIFSTHHLSHHIPYQPTHQQQKCHHPSSHPALPHPPQTSHPQLSCPSRPPLKLSISSVNVQHDGNMLISTVRLPLLYVLIPFTFPFPFHPPVPYSLTLSALEFARWRCLQVRRIGGGGEKEERCSKLIVPPLLIES